jgi:hypothetical protein
MKLGLLLGYSGADMSLPIDRVQEAERAEHPFSLGLDQFSTAVGPPFPDEY